jgi:hypothetical protein
MRNDPEKYSALVYHNNDNQNSLPSSTTSKYNNNNLLDANRQVVLPPSPYDEYIIEGCNAIMLEEAEKLYNVLVDQILCEVSALGYCSSFILSRFMCFNYGLVSQ